ncbi:LAETG motif-containing sortase-dependent surface protein [Kitasatospora sp. NPDC097643]|uniref:LAETG motif-containing sortase-dependent surface protein n=1 Tax=Kitasatospora sp. NPDC097643 TaxID=3157230 RepID=UPI0033330917
MRSSRLLAASTLVALSLGVTVGAATAGAVGVTPTPTATATATATTTATATPSATATAPTERPPHPTPTFTPLPTATPPAPGRCSDGVYQSSLLKVTASGLYGTTLVKGGPAAEITVALENNSGIDLPALHDSVYVTEMENPTGAAWNPENFSIQVNSGSGWKTVQGKERVIVLDDLKLAKGEKTTLHVRIAATAKAPAGKYHGNIVDIGSDVFDNDKVPTPANTKAHGCTQFYGNYEGEFQVAEAGAATTASTPATTAGAVTPAASASPSAGPHLAETGASSNTLPIALGGAAVLAAGAGTLLVLRRRKAGSHS